MEKLDWFPISNWRVFEIADSTTGAACFFDPDSEAVAVRRLTEDEKSIRLDSTVSVRGLVEVEGSVISPDQSLLNQLPLL